MARVHVSGLWVFPDNPKHAADHYYRWLPATFDLLRGDEVQFLSDDEAVLRRAADLARERGVAFVPVRRAVADLPGWEPAAAYVEACAAMRLDACARPADFGREKGVAHYWRDLKGGGPEAYRRMLAIWLSKVFVAAEVARARGSGSIAWVDASVARMNGTRENWDISKAESDGARISHYASPMRMYGHALPLNASYLEGGPAAWQALEGLFAEALPRAARMPYGHDEETVLAECIALRPGLFRCIGRPVAPQGRRGGLRARLGALRRSLRPGTTREAPPTEAPR